MDMWMIFERSFMNMAFGDQVSCTVKDLFKNYEFSDDVYKHAKKKQIKMLFVR